MIIKRQIGKKLNSKRLSKLIRRDNIKLARLIMLEELRELTILQCILK